MRNTAGSLILHICDSTVRGSHQSRTPQALPASPHAAQGCLQQAQAPARQELQRAARSRAWENSRLIFRMCTSRVKTITVLVGYGGGLVGSASGLLTVGRMTRLLGVPWPVDTQSVGAVTERSHSRGHRASNRSGTLQQQSGARKARSASQRDTLVGSNPRSTSPSSDYTQCPICQRDGPHQYAVVCERRAERRPITALQGQTYLDARQRYVHHAVIERLRVKEQVSGLHRLWCSDVETRAQCGESGSEIQ